MLRASIVAVALTAAGALGQGVLRADGTPDPAHPRMWVWLDAASGVNGAASTLPDGTSVTRWDDRSSHGHHLGRVSSTATERPTLRDSTSACGPAVVFDGDDYVWASSTDVGRVTGPRTLFVATRIDSADGGYVIDGSTVSGRSTLHTGQSAAPGHWHVFVGDTSGGALLPVGPPVRTGGFEVHAIVLGATRQQHRIAGQVVSQDTMTQVYNLGGLILGGRYNLANRLRGAIKEVLIYDAELSAADIAALEGYLQARHAQDPPPAPPVVDVFVGGDGRYPNYRIPAITSTMAGTLLAFAEGRQGGDQSRNDIVLRRSFDGGRTWAPHQVLHDDGANALNNPTVVQLRTGPHAGRILLVYQRYPYGTTIWNAAPGYTAANIISCFLMSSDDDGASWSGPFDLTRQMKPPSIARSVNSGPGIGIQLRHGAHAGRVLLPFNRYDIDTTWGNYAVFSDDGGATWQRGADVPRDPSVIQGNECQVVERTDGSIMLDARRSAGARNRKTAVSTDGGQSWSTLAEQPDLPSPGCMASVLRFTDPADGYRSRLFYAGPNSTSSRVNGVLRISYDEGATWSMGKVFAPGSYAYSCLTPVDDRHFGALYERDSYARITFVATTLEWITDRTDCLGNGAHGGSFGSGCAGTGGAVPLLAPDGCPSPGGCLSLTLSAAAPSAPAFVILGLSRTSLPIGPCTFLVGSMVVGVPLTLDATGAGTLALTVPGAAGPFDLTAQGFAMDAGAVLGVSASNGHELRVF